jgi:uncharacterized protein (DUF3084 family)
MHIPWREQVAEGREQRVQSRDTRAESREQREQREKERERERAERGDQREDSREQKAERVQVTKSHSMRSTVAFARSTCRTREKMCAYIAHVDKYKQRVFSATGL